MVSHFTLVTPKHENQFCLEVSDIAMLFCLIQALKNAIKLFFQTSGSKVMLFSMSTLPLLLVHVLVRHGGRDGRDQWIHWVWNILKTSITLEPLVCMQMFIAFLNPESKLGNMALSQTSQSSRPTQPVGEQKEGLDAAHHQEVERFTQTDNSSPDS